MTRIAGSLLSRLVLYVSLGLFAFALVAGAVIYQFAFEHEIDEAASLERQLVYTVQAQAEVAVYAANAQIASDLIDGLRANPRIRAVRISGSGAKRFFIASGFASGSENDAITQYPLYSPIDGKEKIGLLVVARNQALIQAEATLSAIRLSSLLLLQLVATAVLILLAFRRLVGQPIARLARSLAAIQPGSGERLALADEHVQDEIGSLTRSANALISAAESALDEVNALATVDALTGLPNRRAFMERIGLELSRFQRQEAMPASVLMCDLDHFKRINDQHGHAAGDAVLREFGQLMNGELRKIDIAGRLGGEEFAVVLPATTAASALHFAERLRIKVAALVVDHAGLPLKISTSIGVAEMRPTDLRPEEVIARADRALYEAKEKGRNRVEVAPGDLAPI